MSATSNTLPQAVSGDTAPEAVRIGLVSISDRASAGVYVDEGLPALEQWLGSALHLSLIHI